MTAAVEHILGLNHSDFTRAVVLPQGKFCRVLAHGGGRAAPLLERLFALQDYGQRLSDRISSRLNAVELKLSKIQEHKAAWATPAQAVAEAKAAKQAAETEVEAACEAPRRPAGTQTGGRAASDPGRAPGGVRTPARHWTRLRRRSRPQGAS